MEDKELLAWFLEHSDDEILTTLIKLKKMNIKGFSKINTSKARDFAVKMLTIKRNLPFLIEAMEGKAINKEKIESIGNEFIEYVQSMETETEMQNLFSEWNFEFGLVSFFAILMVEKKHEFTFEVFRYFSSIEELEKFYSQMSKENSDDQTEKRFDQITKENEDLIQLLEKQKNSYEEKLRKVNKKNKELQIQNKELQFKFNSTNEKNNKQIELLKIKDGFITDKEDQIKEFEDKMDKVRGIKKSYETNIYLLEKAIGRFKKSVLVFGNTSLQDTLLFHLIPCKVDSLEELNRKLNSENYDEIWVIKFALPEGIQKMFKKVQTDKNIKYFDDYIKVLDELGD